MDDREQIAGPMLHFAREQELPFLRLLLIGNVDGHAADARDVVVFTKCGRGPGKAPTDVAVGTTYTEFRLVSR